MRASSQAALDAGFQALDRAVAQPGADAATIGADLFAMVDALDFSGALRRTLTNPNVAPEARSQFIARLMADRSPGARDTMDTLVAGRWSAERDLADATELLAMNAVLAGAEARGILEQVEDEFYDLDRLLVGNRRLRVTLSDRDIEAPRRVALADRLFAHRLTPETLSLLRRVITRLRSRSVSQSLALLISVAATRRRRTIADVTTAAPLSAAQVTRLGEALTQMFGRELQLNITIDRAVLGGMKIQVGSQMLDATLMSRLLAFRRDLVAHA